MAKFNEGSNAKATCLIPCHVPYKELDKRFLIIFARQKVLVTSLVDLDLLQRQTSMPLKWDSLNSRHLLVGLTPSRSVTTSSLLHSVEKKLMFLQQLLKNASTDYQRSAKDTVSETSSMLMRVASSTDIFSASPLYGLKTHTRIARGKSLGTASLSHLFASQWGEAEGDLGYSKSLHSFQDTKGINPVCYHYNNKAWTTCTEFEAYFSWCNKMMFSQDHKMLLFLGNASAHEHHPLSNIRLEFLPLNTISKLQTLDTRILTEVKALYKKQMLYNISFNVQHNIPATDAAKKIDINAAIEWLSLTWTGVSDLNIQHCFNKVGISLLYSDPNSDSLPDPNLDTDVTDKMRSLIDNPFRYFINFESDEIIHAVVAEPGILQVDVDIVPDDYQSDE